MRSAFLRAFEGKPPDHGVVAEAGTNAVNRMLGLDCPVVDEIAGIGLIRRCEPTYADAEEAEFGAVGFAFEKAACGGENLGGELRRRTERMRAETISFLGLDPTAPITAFVKRLRCSKCGSGSLAKRFIHATAEERSSRRADRRAHHGTRGHIRPRNLMRRS